MEASGKVSDGLQRPPHLISFTSVDGEGKQVYVNVFDYVLLYFTLFQNIIADFGGVEIYPVFNGINSDITDEQEKNAILIPSYDYFLIIMRVMGVVEGLETFSNSVMSASMNNPDENPDQENQQKFEEWKGAEPTEHEKKIICAAINRNVDFKGIDWSTFYSENQKEIDLAFNALNFGGADFIIRIFAKLIAWAITGKSVEQLREMFGAKPSDVSIELPAPMEVDSDEEAPGTS